MDDDLNTSGGMSHVFELVRATNQARSEGATEADLSRGAGYAARIDRG